ncbi:nuclear transport factor 2 family protein [Pendulispora brunnea]|uniref:Nuclear transport factor 2 family protein n=1 Tax=Pendulispora brunnea TaxID=2905690 RepID=A0ABZ2KBX2_9BACT
MTATSADILRIYEQWHATVKARDIEGTLSLYAEDALLETPLALAMLPGKTDGILQGKHEIRPFFEAGIRKFPGEATWYRTGTFFCNGRQLTWEYPRATPHGDQVDLVEMMDIADGLITHHRVYWGWFGFKLLNRRDATLLQTR